MDMSRVTLLEEALNADPSNTFARYALALELSNSSQPTNAWAHFEYLLTHHPNYSATYLQAAKFLISQNRLDEGRQVLARGIEVTAKLGNQHAQGELQATLDSLTG